MTTPTTLTTKQLQRLCARYEDMCPFCHGRGRLRDVFEDSESQEAVCSECKGTGRIPLLEGVRESCKSCQGDGKGRRPKPGGISLAGAFYEVEPTEDRCLVCHGLGWTPTKNVEKWLRPPKRMMYKIEVDHDGGGFVEVFVGTPYASAPDDGEDYITKPARKEFESYDILPALLIVLETVLRPLAVNAAEVEKWVKRNVE